MWNKRISPLYHEKVLIVGQPNVGKSSLFNALSGRYAEISNYPGTTVAIAKTKTSFGELIDTPGICSVSVVRSGDERITIELIRDADLVLNVVSAQTLERDLLLTAQLAEVNPKIILVINQTDEAENRGIYIDAEKLSNLFRTTVVKTAATKSIGVNDVLLAIERAFAKKSEPHNCSIPTNINEISAILSQVVTEKDVAGKIYSDVVGRLLLTPVIGWSVAFLVLYVLFKFLGVIIAGNVVDAQVRFLDNNCYPYLVSAVSNFCGAESLLTCLLVGEFGVLTMGIKTVFAILLPLIVGYNLIMSILEHSGYIPRLSILADNLLKRLGLNGKAVIPILLGFGCSAMGVISSRILESKKERIIATAIIAIAVPCAAQQGVIMSLLASVNDIRIWVFYLVVMVGVTLLSATVIDKIIKGKRSNLMMDIPPMRFPSPYNCIKKTIFKSIAFVRETFLTFSIVCACISLMDKFGMLSYLQDMTIPIVENILRLPKEFSVVFIMGIIRRDVAAAGLFGMADLMNGLSPTALNHTQILVATIVITLFVPCINAMAVIFRESGWKNAVALWVLSFIISIAIGGIVALTAPMLL
ncbi:MAG: ferrous iron transporter B [Holosporaceae bacterium]|jgi:ferrous iron transport protein B|nr:ferrous iron transporter B [Holosporaceae bacterium]